MWKPTQQEALWFHGGNLHQSRHYSLYLALQLKARAEGLDTPVLRARRRCTTSAERLQRPQPRGGQPAARVAGARAAHELRERVVVVGAGARVQPRPQLGERALEGRAAQRGLELAPRPWIIRGAVDPGSSGAW